MRYVSDPGETALADGERAHAIGRNEIPLEQSGRRPEKIGDVVEAERRIIGRQERRNIDVERAQIAHEFAYSLRFRRRMSGRPGLGVAAADFELRS